MSDYDYLFKVIVVGDGAVGKTALTIRFSEGRFQDHYKMTIGVDFAIKLVDVDGRKVKLQIWDTGGQERFSYIRPLYYKGAMAVVYVFDITNRSSFDHLAKWYKEVTDYCGKIPGLLVANKCDLPDKAVALEEAQQVATTLNAPYYEASAKTGSNVDDLFTTLAKILVSQEGLGAPPPIRVPPPIRAPTPAPKPPPIRPSASVPTHPPAPTPRPIAPPAPNLSPEYQAAKAAGDSLEEALSFLNTAEEEPTPFSASGPEPSIAPEPEPIEIPEPEPVFITEPEAVISPSPSPAPFVRNSTPVPFSKKPEPPPTSPSSSPASTSPFTAFLASSKPKESHPSTFIPFVPTTEKTAPVTKPVPASPQVPIILEVAPQAAPSAPAITCPNCGKAISPRWKFCTYCGVQLSGRS